MRDFPKDYATTKARGNGADFKMITGGGHKCEILNVEERFTKTGTSFFFVNFDIKEGGEFDGYYRERYNEDRKAKGEDAKWQGNYTQFVLDLDGKCSPYFKGFIEAVEKSNPGYKFNGDEKTLKNKKVGFVFRDEPFIGNNGNEFHCYRAAWACEVEKAWEQKEPAPKKPRQQNTLPPASKLEQPTLYEEDPQLPF